MAVGNTSVVARDGPQPAAVNRFEVLVEKLREALGPSSGLTSEDVDVTALKKVMEEYDSNPAEWERYSFKNPGQAYTRNLVDEGNGNSNLVRSAGGWQRGRGVNPQAGLTKSTAHPRLVPRKGESHPRPW